MTDRLTPSVTSAITNIQLLIMYGILLQRVFLCYNSCVQSIMGFLKYHFVSELNNEYFTRQIV